MGSMEELLILLLLKGYFHISIAETALHIDVEWPI